MACALCGRRENEGGCEDQAAHGAFDALQPDGDARAFLALDAGGAHRRAIAAAQHERNPSTRLAPERAQGGGEDVVVRFL